MRSPTPIYHRRSETVFSDRVVGEAPLMSTHNLGFYEELTKIIFE